jgi:beta-mannosidase
MLPGSAICQGINLNWQIGYHKTENTLPAKWLPATVPGGVQLDVMKGEKYKQPWWYADNVLQFDWMEDVYFTYKTEFKKPALQQDEHLFFFSKGIDYQFKIYLNGKKIWEQEGMFTYVNVDLTGFLQDNNELKIVLSPVPKLGFDYLKDGAGQYRNNARESAKPAVSYGWDWHPRLVTRGIWDETALVVRKPVRLSDVSLDYTLNGDLTKAQLRLSIQGVQISGKSFKWTLKDPQGKVVLEKQGQLTADEQTVEGELISPSLWWPNGYGNPDLYSNELSLVDNNGNIIEKYADKTGFRRIKLLMNEGAWQKEGFFPKSRATAPACFEVNNRRIFAKGSNWVHPDVFVGLITPERYREQIELAKNAHFNIFRVWGGGIVNKEAFFDICDELGIMVWQEFPLACTNYTDDAAYLKILEQEANSIVKRVKKHASLALWSGGNELFNSWSGMTEQSLALRLLNSICYRLNPQTPFIYTSPLYGMGHGHYIFYDSSVDKEVLQWMSSADKTAYTEFGVPGAANIEVLKSFIPAGELFPPKTGGTWELHHGMKQWQPESWLEISTLEKYFGKIQSLEELVQYSQLLQCEGLKFIFEEARRQKPFCAMALNWCYQEPWPSAANNSLLNWPNVIKPAYYHVANACRPALASIRVPKIQWKEGENFTCDLFILNDSFEALPTAAVSVILQYDGKEETLLKWDFPGTKASENAQGPTVHFRIPRMKSNLFTVKVTVEGRSDYNSSYMLLYSGENVQKTVPPKAYYEGK